MTFSAKTRDRLLFGLLLSLFLVMTITMSFKMNIWVDEACTLNTTKSTLLFAVKHAVIFEEQPPVYFGILSLWRHINNSIPFARLFSILCIVLTSIILARLAEPFPSQRRLFLLCLFLTNPLVLWAATEMRVYAMGMLLSATLWWCFQVVFIKASRNRTHHFLFVAVSLIALYTQYFLGIILIINFIYLLLFRRDWKALLRYVIYMGCVGVFFIPFFIIATTYQIHHFVDLSHPRQITFKGGFWVALQLFINLVLPGNSSWETAFKIVKIVILISGIAAIVAGFRKDKSTGPLTGFTVWACAGLCIGIPLFAVYVFMLRSEDFLPQRYVVFLLPEMLFIILYMAGSVRSPGPRKLFIISCIAYNAVNSAVAYYPMKKEGDWKNVAKFIDEKSYSDQWVFVYPPVDALAFSFYFHDSDKIVPIPVPPSLDILDLKENVLYNDRQIDTIVSNRLLSAQDCWFVFNDVKGCQNVVYNSHVLPEYIHQNFTVLEYRNFFPTQVYHVKKKQRGGVPYHSIVER